MPRHRIIRFPDPEEADPEGSGLLGVGGWLDVQTLEAAYRVGVFPWPSEEGLLAWWSPEPRAIIEFSEFHIARRLARTYRQGRFELTINRDFSSVIHACAEAPYRPEGTWITSDMLTAYEAFHRTGFAHSVEAWQDGRLAGGLYGVGMGGLFAAESMFFRVPDAAKVALVYLVERLQACGFTLLDVQQLNPNTARFGAREIPRREFLDRLRAALPLDVQLSPLANPIHAD